MLHLVPPPLGGHQRFGSELLAELRPLAQALGLVVSYETGVWKADDDYRIPGLAVYPPERPSRRGIDGPPHLVVEIRSPGDETAHRIGWYLSLGVAEVVVVDRDRTDI